LCSTILVGSSAGLWCAPAHQRGGHGSGQLQHANSRHRSL